MLSIELRALVEKIPLDNNATKCPNTEELVTFDISICHCYKNYHVVDNNTNVTMVSIFMRFIITK